jgi:hypothetical protein
MANMSERQFVGRSRAGDAWIFAGLVALITALMAANDEISLQARLLICASLAAATAVVTLAVLASKLQDIVDVNLSAQTIRVRRRRALRPDIVREYSTADVSSVVVTRVVGDGGDEHGAHARMSDRQKYDLVETAHFQRDAVDQAKQFIAAIGRDDLQVLMDNPDPSLPTPA